MAIIWIIKWMVFWVILYECYGDEKCPPNSFHDKFLNHIPCRVTCQHPFIQNPCLYKSPTKFKHCNCIEGHVIDEKVNECVSTSKCSFNRGKGPKGDPGQQGPQGILGPKGPTGSRGPTGRRGQPGGKGLMGPLGPPGPSGPRGSPGPSGLSGPLGSSGPSGPSGPPGTSGMPGMPGTPGTPGPPGPAGPPGPPAPVGKVNIIEPRGPRGMPGSSGEPGVQGEKGEPGFKGGKGDKGDKGNKGNKGDKGESGEIGPAGAPGKCEQQVVYKILCDPQKHGFVLKNQTFVPTLNLTLKTKSEPKSHKNDMSKKVIEGIFQAKVPHFIENKNEFKSPNSHLFHSYSLNSHLLKSQEIILIVIVSSIISVLWSSCIFGIYICFQKKVCCFTKTSKNMMQ